MVTICRISQVNYSEYDEVWAIVRSLKYGSPKIRHVPELSPSWPLFKRYMKLKEEGQWNEETFQKLYVPQFLKEMRGEKQQKLMNELFCTTKRICLVCFCDEEELCHRSIVGGMLQGAGLEVKGLMRDYSYYYDWYKNGVPGVQMAQKDGKKLTDERPDAVMLYKTDSPETVLGPDVPTMCFTGRRPKDLCGYDIAKYNGFVQELSELLYEEFYVGRGVRRFINGAAQGFDQMSFWAVERMKKLHNLTDVENVVFVAFEHQEIRWAKSGCFSQAEYWLMIKAADKVMVVCSENSIEALFARNHAMCDFSDYCLALYPDDSWPSAKGGTAECLRYAVNSHPDVLRLGYSIDNAGLHMGDMVSTG